MRRSLVLLALPSLLTAAHPSVRELSLKTPDGFTLKGTLTVPAGHGRHAAVILAHQFQSDRAGWAPLAEQLQKHGIATLALDLRGHGQSTDHNGASLTVGEDFKDSAKRVGFDQIPHDLELVAAWLRRQPGIDGRRLGLAGSSVGALSALLAAPQGPPHCRPGPQPRRKRSIRRRHRGEAQGRSEPCPERGLHLRLGRGR